VDAEYYPLTQVLEVEFTVEPTPLVDNDAGAEVGDVTFQMGGTTIDLADAEVSPGSYRLEVDLTDSELFDPSPDGPLPLTVSASNQRNPTPVTAINSQQVSIDGAPPTIQIIKPTDKDVIGGNVPLTFKVNDSVSGVDVNSVAVSLNDVEQLFDATSDQWDFSNDTFTFEFDSRQIKNSKVQVTVNVRASDGVGNASAVASMLLYLDNYAPSIDLDPLDVRTVAQAQAKLECSIAFDPVGDAAKNDLDSAVRAGLFRAIVWENTNIDPEIPEHYYSVTDPDSVKLYLREASEGPLLVDKDHDGTCDDVYNVDSINALSLTVLGKQGNPRYQLGDEASLPTPASLACETKDAMPPIQLCQYQASDMWQVIQHPDDENVIYAASPTPDEFCTGVTWEFGSKVNADGWVCFAARAVDYARNVGVSRPLRICVDDTDVPGSPPCATSIANPPSCADQCTPPERFGGFGVRW
jgi:hypothetical protein